MLDRGHYYGLEGEPELVRAGMECELLFDMATLKQPRFGFNYEFDLSFCDEYDFAIAQSLFTHLTKDDISKCFDAMSRVANDHSRFYFTFFEGDESRNVADHSHANRNWFYRFDTLRTLAGTSGFSCDYIGDWGHERKQMMAVAVKAP